MALALNLRGDLTKLSDAELAERLAEMWARHDASRRWSFGPLFSFRWPLRPPRVYRFFWALGAMRGGISGHWIDLLFPLVMSSKLTDALVDAAKDDDLALCEIRDIQDEIERRLKLRKASVQ